MTAIVAGIGQTRFARRTGATEMALAAGAITAALRDAGLAPRDVDGVVRFDRDAMWEYDLPGVLSLSALHFYNAVPFGPGSAPALLRMAAMAVTQGLATTVLAFHARDGRVRATPPPALEAALLARRFGITEAEIAAVTIAHRRAAAKNPRALVRRPLTAATRRESAYVAEPLRRVDLAAPAAGACAFVVTGEERARSFGRRPIRILGSLQAAIPSATCHLPEWFARKPLEEIARAARAMFKAARVRPGDVDLACVNADASPLVTLALRAYGVDSARVNPHGGQLCEAALDGINDVIAAVRRLRGAPASRARVALVSGSLLEPTSAVLLGADSP